MKQHSGNSICWCSITARLAILVGTIAFLASASVPAVAAPSMGVDAIGAYAGTWEGRLTYYKTAYSKAHSEELRVRNDCWHSSEYFTCHQFVDGKSAALIVYSYDAHGDVYHVHVVPSGAASGGPPGTLTIHGNVWTFPWQDDDHGKAVYYRVINIFRDARTIVFHQSYSFDRVHWIPTGDGTEHRVATTSP